MKTCSDSDCDRTDISGRGLCSMHYQRYRYRGNLDEVVPARSEVCVVCGADLPADRDHRTIYCSKACNWRAREQRRHGKREEDRRATHCEQCGVSMFGQRTDARFCTEKCGDDFRNAKRAARLRANRKPCVHCGKPIPLNRQRFCSDECTLAHRRPEKYGLSRDELAALLEQHNVCAICRTADWRRKGPQVDHDHATGRVRGILCPNCNLALGLLNDDPARLRAAAEYLEGWYGNRRLHQR